MLLPECGNVNCVVIKQPELPLLMHSAAHWGCIVVLVRDYKSSHCRPMLQGAWQPLFAPATTVALRGAVGDFCVADMLEAALERKPRAAGATDHLAAAEATESGGGGSPAGSGGSGLSDSSWEVL
jgi:hypothetical protein